MQSIDSAVREALAELCTRQWAALGGLGRREDRRVRALVDPEALVLASVIATEADYRLSERLGWWSRVGARLTSVQRMRSIAGSLPPPWRSSWRAFAAAAVEGGGASWRAHAAVSDDVPIRHRATAERDEPSFAEPGALVLRMRTGFGVNARADVLACLVAVGDQSLTASRLARELVYSESATKRAAREMARAGLIRETSGHPAEYSVGTGWTEVLGLDAALRPTWIPWGLVVPFFADALDWTRTTAGDDGYVRASRARDLFDRHRRTLERLPIALPDPARHPGAAFTAAFGELVARATAWSLESC